MEVLTSLGGTNPGRRASHGRPSSTNRRLLSLTPQSGPSWAEPLQLLPLNNPYTGTEVNLATYADGQLSTSGNVARHRVLFR